METKTKMKGNTTPSNSSGREILNYYEFNKKMRQLEFILGDLDDYKFQLNKKAVKEVDKYYNKNSLNPKFDKSYTKAYIDDFKKLASKLNNKYIIGRAYSNINISNELKCSALNIKGEDFERLTSMFKSTNTITIEYDKLPLRLLVYYSKDKKLNDLLNHCIIKHEDFYAHIAAIIFNDSYINCLEFKSESIFGELKVVPNPTGRDKRIFAKQVIFYEIYRQIPDIKYKEDFLNYVNIFENYFTDLKSWVHTMMKYNKPYIQDVFGNVITFKESYLKDKMPQMSICALINLTESSIHKLFLSALLYENKVNIRLPLKQCVIIDYDENKYTCGEVICYIRTLFKEMFEKYNIDININI